MLVTLGTNYDNLDLRVQIIFLHIEINLNKIYMTK